MNSPLAYHFNKLLTNTLEIPYNEIPCYETTNNDFFQKINDVLNNFSHLNFHFLNVSVYI